MYNLVLPLHSLVRWLVLVSLLVAIVRSYQGWLGRKPYTKADHQIRQAASGFAQLQFGLGVWLYFVSPITTYFIHHFKEAVAMREIRFFGMEHVTMMLIGIALVTLGSARAKRKTNDTAQFKTQAIWFTIALVIILSSIPWAFSPLVHRPWVRGF